MATRWTTSSIAWTGNDMETNSRRFHQGRWTGFGRIVSEPNWRLAEIVISDTNRRLFGPKVPVNTNALNLDANCWVQDSKEMFFEALRVSHAGLPGERRMIFKF